MLMGGYLSGKYAFGAAGCAVVWLETTTSVSVYPVMWALQHELGDVFLEQREFLLDNVPGYGV